jgi:hypothetical protein
MNKIEILRTSFNNQFDIFEVEKTFDNVDELFDSEEIKEIFRGYENEISNRKRIFSKAGSIKAYKVPRDPKLNYGQDFSIFWRHKAPDGLEIINELTISTGLFSQNLRSAVVIEDEILMLGKKGLYSKHQASRRQLAQRGIMVW